MAQDLGIDLNRFQHTYFPSKGPLNKVGLSVAGSCLAYGTGQTVFEQDASILSGILSGGDVAMFYYDLFG